MIQRKAHPELDELCAAKVRYISRVYRQPVTTVIEEAIDRMYRECKDAPPEPTLITEEIPRQDRFL